MHYRAHLSKDKKLGKLLASSEGFTLKRRVNIPLYLCASIMSQQLSTKVADVIYNRFFSLYGGKKPSVQQILDTDPAQLRGIGISAAKTSYILNVCRFAEENHLSWRQLNKMDKEAAISYLSQIKGVGRWTAEMLLMFALQREDVFSVDDLGIQTAMKRLYKIEASDNKTLKSEMIRIAAKWSPYRTYACLHLWSWKDNTALK